MMKTCAVHLSAVSIYGHYRRRLLHSVVPEIAVPPAKNLSELMRESSRPILARQAGAVELAEIRSGE